MEKSCISCLFGYDFAIGLCRCKHEPTDSNLHYDNYCCAKHHPVSEKTIKLRIKKIAE